MLEWSARDEFRRFCSRLFDYELWNHIPQVIEVARAIINTVFDRIGFAHGLWNHF